MTCCQYDNQTLQLFTSSLFLAGIFSTLVGGYTSRYSPQCGSSCAGLIRWCCVQCVIYALYKFSKAMQRPTAQICDTSCVPDPHGTDQIRSVHFQQQGSVSSILQMLQSINLIDWGNGLCRRLGRKATILTAGACFIVSAMCTAAVQIGMLITGRIMIGSGNQVRALHCRACLCAKKGIDNALDCQSRHC